MHHFYMSMSLEANDLDVSLFETMDKIGNVQSHSMREPMKELDCYFIFIDSSMSITKIVSEKETLVKLDAPNTIGIHKDRLLQMVQSKRSTDHKKYKLIHWMQFHVGLEPENTQAFLENENIDPSEFVKTPSYLVDLVVQDSIFIFHDINSLFFFFKESETKTRSGKTMKQMLLDHEKRITKKVRFLT